MGWYQKKGDCRQRNRTSTLSHCASSQKSEDSLTVEEGKRRHWADWVCTAPSQLTVVTTLLGCPQGFSLPSCHPVAGPRFKPRELKTPKAARPSEMTQKGCILDTAEYKLRKTYINILAGPVQVVIRPGSWASQLQHERWALPVHWWSGGQSLLAHLLAALNVGLGLTVLLWRPWEISHAHSAPSHQVLTDTEDLEDPSPHPSNSPLFLG